MVRCNECGVPSQSKDKCTNPGCEAIFKKVEQVDNAKCYYCSVDISGLYGFADEDDNTSLYGMCCGNPETGCL